MSQPNDDAANAELEARVAEFRAEHSLRTRFQRFSQARGGSMLVALLLVGVLLALGLVSMCSSERFLPRLF